MKVLNTNGTTALAYAQKCIDALNDSTGLKMSLKVRTQIQLADSNARIAQSALIRLLDSID